MKRFAGRSTVPGVGGYEETPIKSIVPGVGRYDETPISDVRYDMDEIERQYSVRPDKPIPGRVFCPGPYFHELVEMYERGEIELYDDLDEDDGAPRAAPDEEG